MRERLANTVSFVELFTDVLRYEYLTQLLLDANYIPLVLKLWQSQDVGRWCHFTVDRAWMG